MSGSKGKPLLCSTDENARTSRDIVEDQFLRSALTANVAKNRNLVESLRTVMSEAGIEKDKVEHSLSLFDPTVTVGEFQGRGQNSHLVKAKGFSSFEAFRAFVEENRETKRAWEIEITPRYLLSLVKVNDSLLSDAARESYLSNLKRYVAEVEKDEEEEVRIYDATDEGARQTLLTIRRNVLKNATLRLASEQQLFTQSLAEYADGGDFLPKRIFPPKTTAKFLKFMGSSKVIDLDLAKPEASDMPLAFNCNHCPSRARPRKSASSSSTAAAAGSSSTAKENKKRRGNGNDDNDDDIVGDDANAKEDNVFSDRREKLVFVSPIMGEFNVLKAQPLDTLDDCHRHNSIVHCLGEPTFSAAKLGSHPYCIMCRLCGPQALRDAFQCCLGESLARSHSLSFALSLSRSHSLSLSLSLSHIWHSESNSNRKKNRIGFSNSIFFLFSNSIYIYFLFSSTPPPPFRTL